MTTKIVSMYSIYVIPAHRHSPEMYGIELVLPLRPASLVSRHFTREGAEKRLTQLQASE